MWLKSGKVVFLITFTQIQKKIKQTLKENMELQYNNHSSIIIENKKNIPAVGSMCQITI